jgi:hypothetical protein
LGIRGTGYVGGVLDGEGPCTFRPCEQPAVTALRLLVDGCESSVTVCHAHAQWLQTYVESDTAVQLADRGPTDGRANDEDAADEMA